jgi:hypothetical protein
VGETSIPSACGSTAVSCREAADHQEATAAQHVPLSSSNAVCKPRPRAQAASAGSGAWSSFKAQSGGCSASSQRSGLPRLPSFVPTAAANSRVSSGHWSPDAHSKCNRHAPGVHSAVATQTSAMHTIWKHGRLPGCPVLIHAMLRWAGVLQCCPVLTHAMLCQPPCAGQRQFHQHSLLE